MSELHAILLDFVNFLHPNTVNSDNLGEGVQEAQGTHVPCYWSECSNSHPDSNFCLRCTSHVLVRTLHQSLPIGMKVGILGFF